MATRKSNKSAIPVKTRQTRGMTSAPAMRPAVRPAPAPMPAPAQITHEAIARRAREIWLSGRGGSDLANWLQAEKELRAGR